LSIKRTQAEPWTNVSGRYELGQVVDATITQIASFGAFARLEDGVEGLIHVSEMGDGRIQHPRELVKENDTVPVRIIRIDPTRKRIGLSMRRVESDDGNYPVEDFDYDIPEPGTEDTLDVDALSVGQLAAAEEPAAAEQPVEGPADDNA
jgi:small subunit ribosomal protein S1